MKNGNDWRAGQIEGVVDPEQTGPEPEPFVVPIDGELDLHNFSPKELGELIPEYLWACRQEGLLEVRIVHGKGRGQLKRSVEAILSRLPEVARFSVGGPGHGSWGATVVNLYPLQPDSGKE